MSRARPSSFSEDIGRLWRLPPPATLVLTRGAWQRAAGFLSAWLTLITYMFLHGSLAEPVLGTTCRLLLGLVAWFVIRRIPAEPDLTSSAAWHLIPLLLGWNSVRLEKGLVP
jgi:hypothetical protein